MSGTVSALGQPEIDQRHGYDGCVPRIEYGSLNLTFFGARADLFCLKLRGASPSCAPFLVKFGTDLWNIGSGSGEI